MEVAAAYRPAAEEVGGDFYDLWHLGESTWAFAVGDVCGTGAHAAGFTAVARATLRAFSLTQPRPTGWLRGLNAALLAAPGEGERETFCTVIAGTLQPGPAGAVVRLATGGHPPPLLRRADSPPEALPVRGTLIGLFSDVEVGELEIALRPGDQLVLYTDGVTDSRRSDGTIRGEGGLFDLLQAGPRQARVLVDDLVGRLWEDGSPDDDVALLVVEPTSRDGS
jgi:sigma-B regulation protein RsbU (phosphoserine phosphatase)